MKRIFLIGDSIRIGYDSRVRELLSDRAQLYWSNDNARFVAYTLRYASEWAAEDCDASKIDVVHWNNGLWDVLNMLGDAAQTPLEEYGNGLSRIAKRLKLLFPNAVIAFALTTSVIEERMRPGFSRTNAEIEAYNAVAREVMAKENIPVNDLYTVARDMPDDWHAADGTHFTDAGYQALAEAVFAFLGSYLD